MEWHTTYPLNNCFIAGPCPPNIRLIAKESSENDEIRNRNSRRFGNGHRRSLQCCTCIIASACHPCCWPAFQYSWSISLNTILLSFCIRSHILTFSQIVWIWFSHLLALDPIFAWLIAIFARTMLDRRLDVQVVTNMTEWFWAYIEGWTLCEYWRSHAIKYYNNKSSFIHASLNKLDQWCDDIRNWHLNWSTMMTMILNRVNLIECDSHSHSHCRL